MIEMKRLNYASDIQECAARIGLVMSYEEAQLIHFRLNSYGYFLHQDADALNGDRYSISNLYPQNVLETVFWLFFCTTSSDNRAEEMAKEKYIEVYDAGILSRIFPNL